MILGIDTSIGTAVALVDADGRTLAARDSTDTRGHAEAIGTLLADVLAAAGAAVSDVEAVAVGMGPGPFTGLRVGIAAARAFAIAREVPLLPVASHVAVAAESAERGERGRVVIVTDARRREHYWTLIDLGEGTPPGRGGSAGDAPRRAGIPSPSSAPTPVSAATSPPPATPIVVAGPGLTPPEALAEVAGVGPEVRRIEPVSVSAASLARHALRMRAAGLGTGTAQPLYLREPDVTPSRGPKRVSG